MVEAKYLPRSERQISHVILRRWLAFTPWCAKNWDQIIAAFHSRRKRQRDLTSAAWCRNAVLVGALSLTPTAVPAEWGSIGAGWKPLGKDPHKQEIALEKDAKLVKRAPQRSLDTKIADSGVTRANQSLTRSVAAKYSNDPVLAIAAISPQEFIIFFESMIGIESRFNDQAVSRAGAIGLAQLMPGTATYLNVDPHDRRQNLEGGARYLIEQIETFGTLSLAVAAYNAGPKAIQKYNGIPPFRETERHVALVMTHFERQWRMASKE